MTQPVWNIDAEARRATCAFIGGTLAVWRDAGGVLRGQWNGPAQVETKAQALTAINAAVLAAEQHESDTGAKHHGLTDLRLERDRISEGPDVIRKANPNLIILLRIHHRGERTIEALNNVAGEVAGSLRITHPGFYSRIGPHMAPALVPPGPEPF